MIAPKLFGKALKQKRRKLALEEPLDKEKKMPHPASKDSCHHSDPLFPYKTTQNPGKKSC